MKYEQEPKQCPNVQTADTFMLEKAASVDMAMDSTPTETLRTITARNRLVNQNEI